MIDRYGTEVFVVLLVVTSVVLAYSFIAGHRRSIRSRREVMRRSPGVTCIWAQLDAYTAEPGDSIDGLAWGAAAILAVGKADLEVWRRSGPRLLVSRPLSTLSDAYIGPVRTIRGDVRDGLVLVFNDGAELRMRVSMHNIRQGDIELAARLVSDAAGI